MHKRALRRNQRGTAGRSIGHALRMALLWSVAAAECTRLVRQIVYKMLGDML
jgi:hypothetical protein